MADPCIYQSAHLTLRRLRIERLLFIVGSFTSKYSPDFQMISFGIIVMLAIVVFQKLLTMHLFLIILSILRMTNLLLTLQFY